MMNEIMRTDFETGTSKVSVIFNTTIISPTEVDELIDNDLYEGDTRIIVTTPDRADAVSGISPNALFKESDLYERKNT